ncbi:MAG: efflux RND transporter permease subunit [Gammaproteobacteria bacterium]|nr:efflux RND transporter permease subunit [Gammaproteobacteria bacterium]
MADIQTGFLAGIIRHALRYRTVVLILALLLIVWGVFDLGQARYDVFPEFAPPQVVIQTESPGLPPEAVESLVSQPLENALNGVEGLATLRSNSIQGLSVITATFDAGSDIYRDRQAVAERLSAASSQLPTGVSAPLMTPLTSSTSTLLVIGLLSDQRSLMDVRTLADWTVKQRLLAVPGVAKVSVFGGDVREFQIQIDPTRLLRYGVSVTEVLDAARKATGVRGAGFIDNSNQRLTLRSEGQAINSAALAKTVLRRDHGASLSIGDVATVIEASEPPIGAASFAGKPAVQLMISEQYGANTLEVTRRVEAAIAELTPLLEREQVQLKPIFRPADFIEHATGNVTQSLLLGSILVVIILALFLANVRTALISLSAIPLSLLTATLVLKGMNQSLNTMTLGGLSIAIGLLVDDAVITVENIFKRLRENRESASQRSAFNVILMATLEVRSAVVYATLAIGLVFLPVLGLSGLAGRLFSPLALSYLIATLASLVVALTVTPALCLMLLPQASTHATETHFEKRLKAAYAKALGFIEKHFQPIIVGLIILLLLTLAAIPFFGGGFIPELKEGHFIVHMSAVPGTSLAESERVGQRIATTLLKLPEVKHVAQRVGRAEAADDTWGTHYSEIDVELKPLSGKQAEAAQEHLHQILTAFPGINFSIKPFLTERIEETLSGYTAAVAINLYGDNLDQIDAKAAEIASVLKRLHGATDIQIQSPQGTPELVTELNRDALLQSGIAPTDALDVLSAGLEGNTVGQVYDGNKVIPVSVILSPENRRSPDDIKRLPITNASGEVVPLGNVIQLYEHSGRYVVLHNGARRVQTITANVMGRDVASFVAEAQQRLATVKLPSGSYLVFAGAAEEQARSTRVLLMQSAGAGIGLIILLSMFMGSSRNLILVLVNLPFALIGGVLAVLASGGLMTLGGLVGFITLFGITLRNSVMLLSRYEQLYFEGQVWNWHTAWMGAQERLIPILMTALVTALGLLPLAIGSGEPGREIEGPMAIVILGGLITSTTLNLLVLPSLALRFARFQTHSEE